MWGAVQHRGHQGWGRTGSPAPPHSLTFPYIFLTLAHIHVDELWPLYTEGENVRMKLIRCRNTQLTSRPTPPVPHPAAAPNPTTSPSRPHCHLRKVRLHSVATALARRVLPVPGGPWSRRPERLRPRLSSSGCSRGSWMVSRISFFTSCSPPTSCQDTEGI